MFILPDVSASTSVHSCSFCLETIDADTLKTPNGRRDYLNFLNRHTEIKPVLKLYGLNLPPDLTNEKIRKQAIKILAALHPDRELCPKEKEFCQFLFKRVGKVVNDWKESIKQKERFLSPFIFDIERKSPKEKLWGFIKSDQWCFAKDIIANFSWEQIKDDEDLAILVSICYVQFEEIDAVSSTSSKGGAEISITSSVSSCCSSSLTEFKTILQNGNFETAINFIPESLYEVKELLERCKPFITYQTIRESPEIDYAVFQKLVVLISNFHELKYSSKYGEKIDALISYNLFNIVKEYYRKQNDKLNYEINLRESIRRCSSRHEKVKRELIMELKEHIRINHKVLLPVLSVEDEMKLLTKSIIDQCKTELIGYHLTDASSLLSQFNERVRIEEKKDHSEEVDDRSPLLTETKDSLFNSLHKITQAIQIMEDACVPKCGFFSWFTEPPNDEKKKKIDRIIRLMRGIKYYFEGIKNRAQSQDATLQFNQAAHEFIYSREQLLIGWMKIHFHKFSQAVEIFGKSENSRALEYIVRVMNFCDTSFDAKSSDFNWEGLKEIDDIQRGALNWILERG